MVLADAIEDLRITVKTKIPVSKPKLWEEMGGELVRFRCHVGKKLHLKWSREYLNINK